MIARARVEVQRLLHDRARRLERSRSGARSRRRSRARGSGTSSCSSARSSCRAGVPAGRIETLASQRSEPSSMFTSETPSWRSVVRSSCSHSRACGGGAQVGLGDDLDQRRAAAVEVDDATRRRRGSGPTRRRGSSLAASSSRCTRWMRTSPSWPPLAERIVVLADLVALRAGRDRSSSCGGRSSAARSRSRAPAPIISAVVDRLAR